MSGESFTSFISGLGHQCSDTRDVVHQICINKLHPSIHQPRESFVSEALQHLADSIQQQGIIQPLVVMQSGGGKYEIIAGERRYRAAKLIGLKHVPCVVRQFSEEASSIVALIENIQRENLNPIEEAKGFKRLKESYGLSQEEISQRVGKPRSSITNSLRLLNLPQDVQQYLIEGRISFGHGKLLLSLSYEQQKEVADIVIIKGFTVRKLEEYIKHMSKNTAEARVQEFSFIDTTALEKQLKEIFSIPIEVIVKKNSKKQLIVSDEFIMNGLLDALKY